MTDMDILTAPDGTAIHFVKQGQGRPIIFLHGWTAESREWLPYATQLAAQFQVFCWDARGHGDHPVSPECDTHICNMAADLDLLIRHHQLTDVVLVGHSMGALTAWQYIRDYGTGALAGLCVIDQSPKLETDDQWHEGVYGKFSAEDNREFIATLTQDFALGVLGLVGQGHNRRSRENYESNSRGFQKMADYLRRLPADQLIHCWGSLSREDYRAVLPQIDVPALLIYGDESQFYSQNLARWVASQIPESELHIYEDSDHSPHLWHKERFINHLRSFAQAL